MDDWEEFNEASLPEKKKKGFLQSLKYAKYISFKLRTRKKSL